MENQRKKIIEDAAWKLYQGGIKVQWKTTPLLREDFPQYEDYEMFMETVERFIEDIAWQVFVNKLGLSFTGELTPEEKLTITDKDEFEYYREEAVKIYEKKQRALLNKKYPVIEIPTDGRSGMIGGAYTLCFVYSKYNGNFVLKGYLREVEAYLKKNYTHYFYNLSLWNRGMHRDIWHFWKKNIGIFQPESKSKDKERRKFRIREYSCSYDNDTEEQEKEKIELSFKRLPKRWIPEFNLL